jgi:hypothetical protein
MHWETKNQLLKVIQPAYGPCPHFRGVCKKMRWDPSNGHVPRGFWGALGNIRDVELVLVFAEPGDPLPGESHTGIESAMEFSLACLRTGATPFHRNVRHILNLCFPGQSLDEQLRRTWRTNSVLCSAERESGPVLRAVEDTCMKTYLRAQLDLLEYALIAAFGGKAQSRLKRGGFQFVPALHPSCRESNEKKDQSWRALAAALHSRPAKPSTRPKE